MWLYSVRKEKQQKGLRNSEALDKETVRADGAIVGRVDRQSDKKILRPYVEG